MKHRVIIVRSNGVNPDSRVEKEANSLSKAGYDVTIIAWDRSSNYKEKIDKVKLQDTCVNRVSFGAKAEFGAGFKSLIPFLLFQKRLFCWMLFNRRKYEIAHLCDFDTAFTGRLAARICRKKYVFDIFDYLSTDPKTIFGKAVRIAENRIINTATAVIICTEDRRKQIQNTSPKKLEIIHNSPSNINIGTAYKRNKSERIKIAYVGILQDYRLLKEMIHAVESRKDIELHIGGFGKYEEYIKKEADKYDNVVFYGKLPYKNTLELENECDIMTAIYDPTIGNHKFAAPNKFYEALFLGKPLMMVKATGMSQVIQREKIGVLIDYSENGFLKGLDQLISIKDEWGKIGQREKELYNELYSWKIMEGRLIELYDSILKE